MSTNITPEIEREFEAIRSASNIALFSCFWAGKPTVAIVAINQPGEDEYQIGPLYVRYDPDMELTDHDGTPLTTEEV